MYRLYTDAISIVTAGEVLLINFSPHFSAPPTIVNIQDTVVRDLGETVNVTCKATGNPSPSVKWVTKTEDGRHAPVTQSDYKNQTFKINSVKDHHYGEYVCIAENRFGNDTVAFALSKF